MKEINKIDKNKKKQDKKKIRKKWEKNETKAKINIFFCYFNVN